MEMWVDEKYDLLVQEADRCNSSLRVSKGTFDDDAVARIFSRLMLQGKLKAAVQFATERSKGSVLHPSDIINDSMSSDSLQLLPNSINTQSQSGNQVSVSIIHNLTSNNLIMMILVIVM